jgi:hypothetical protein
MEGRTWEEQLVAVRPVWSETGENEFSTKVKKSKSVSHSNHKINLHFWKLNTNVEQRLVQELCLALSPLITR